MRVRIDGLTVLNVSGYNVSDDAQLSYMREHGEPIDDWVFDKCETWEQLFCWLGTLSERQRSHSINIMLDDCELTFADGVGLAPENVMIEENEIVLLLER